MGTPRRLFVLTAICILVAGCVQGPDGDPGPTATPPPTETDGPAGTPSPSPTPTPEPDRSNETLDILIEADGPWRVAVPLPVSDPGTSAEEWEANLSVTGDATTALVETGHGTVLEVEGTGHVKIQAHAVQPPLRGNRCCAEAYLDAEWSAGKDDDGNVRAGVWDGSIILEVEYDAVSRSCHRSDHLVGEGTASDQQLPALAEEEDPVWFPLGGEHRTGCA